MFDIASFFGKKIEQGIDDMSLKGGISIDETLAPSSTHTEEIELNGTWGAGMVQFYVPQSAAGAYRRYGATIMCGVQLTEAISHVHYRETISIGCGCFTNVVSSHYYFYENDSVLSGNFFSGNSRLARIKSVMIDGTKLKIAFQNTHATLSSALKIDGRYTVWKSQENT